MKSEHNKLTRIDITLSGPRSQFTTNSRLTAPITPPAPHSMLLVFFFDPSTFTFLHCVSRGGCKQKANPDARVLHAILHMYKHSTANQHTKRLRLETSPAPDGQGALLKYHWPTGHPDLRHNPISGLQLPWPWRPIGL